MKRVAIGLLGTKLDGGTTERRWEEWRPSVSLFQHEELLFDRFELLSEPQFGLLRGLVAADARLVSPETEVREHEIDFGKDPWNLERVYGALHAWARSYVFDPEREEYYIHITTGTHIAQISLFLLVEAGYLPGKLIQTAPRSTRVATDPKGQYAVIDLDLSKYDALATRFAEDAAGERDLLKSGIATRNAGFNRLIERIGQVALRSGAPMLLTGPTGAGKSLLARRIYELRRQRGLIRGAFVEVNCATLGGDTAASALFGHVRGAFTGAQSERAGLLREADGGLVFLDEIAELGADEQAMLLRALEDKTFLPVGADKPVSSDFQLIAGTNRDLRAAVAEGEFREDLLARINLWTFALPALRERREDIAPNLDFELARFGGASGRQASFNKEARQAFLAFAESGAALWSGNFRDLNAAVTRMATLAPRGRIRVEEVEEEIGRLKESWKRPGAGVGMEMGMGQSGAEEGLRRVMGEEALAKIDPFDRAQLGYVVEVCRRARSVSEAGRELFAVSRLSRSVQNDADRLRKYLGRFGLDFEGCRG